MKDLFQPLCLTAYLGGKCPLNCLYCYSDKNRPIDNTISNEALKKVLYIVAKNCLANKVPLAIVFHGVNEPLLYQKKIVNILKIAQEVANDCNLKLFRACTTCGVVSNHIIEWAKNNFDHITLSWDGPDFVHNRNRPLKNGKGSSSAVRKAAEIILQSKCALTVRSTVTIETSEHILNTVFFFKQQGIERVVFNPVYPNRNNSFIEKLVPPPKLFAFSFLKARAWGIANDMEIIFPGVRPRETHDRYCSILQKNLAITSDGYFSFCFLVTHFIDCQDMQFQIGHIENDQIFYKNENLKRFFKIIKRGFKQCEKCFNKNHCAKCCPTICPMLHSYSKSFDCSAEKIIGNVLLFEQENGPIPFEEIDCYLNKIIS